MAILLGIVASSACPFGEGATGMPSRPPSAAAVAAGMPPISPAVAAGMPTISPAVAEAEDGDLEALARPAVADGDLEARARPAAADGDLEALARPAAADDDVEVLAPPAARAEVERGGLRRIKIKSPSFLFSRVFSGVARAGDILCGAYRRSFVAGYIFEFTALCAATYRRSVVAVYIAEFSSLCARSWAAVGIVFNPLPAGTQLLPISDPPERLCFVLDMERLQLLVLSVLVLGAVLFISLERLLMAYEKTCDFYINIEWHRMDMALARNVQQLPPPAAEQQQLPPPVGEQQQLLPPVGEQQQLPPPATKQQQLPPLPTEQQQQQLPAHATEQQLLPPPLPPEMDMC